MGRWRPPTALASPLYVDMSRHHVLGHAIAGVALDRDGRVACSFRRSNIRACPAISMRTGAITPTARACSPRGLSTGQSVRLVSSPNGCSAALRSTDRGLGKIDLSALISSAPTRTRGPAPAPKRGRPQSQASRPERGTSLPNATQSSVSAITAGLQATDRATPQSRIRVPTTTIEPVEVSQAACRASFERRSPSRIRHGQIVRQRPRCRCRSRTKSLDAAAASHARYDSIDDPLCTRHWSDSGGKRMRALSRDQQFSRHPGVADPVRAPTSGRKLEACWRHRRETNVLVISMRSPSPTTVTSGA